MIALPRTRRPHLIAALASAAVALLVLGLATPAEASTRAPVGGAIGVTQWTRGVVVTGWALDPDTSRAVVVDLMVDGAKMRTATANVARTDLPSAYKNLGRNHGLSVPLYLKSGAHRVCFVAHDVQTGQGRALSCKSFTVRNSPFGSVTSLKPYPGGISVGGWAIDYDVITTPLKVSIIVDYRTKAVLTANQVRNDLASLGAWAKPHGFATIISLPYATHHVCVVAQNVGGGADKTLSCGWIKAGNQRPSQPGNVAVRVSGQVATVSWGGGPARGTSITKWIVQSVPAGLRKAAVAGARHAEFWGLTPRQSYRFTVTAVNAVGNSPVSAASNAIIGPPPPIAPVTSPALISTSRYIRNIHGKTTDRAVMFKMGATDATYNPSNHRYLVLLDIGGQTLTQIGLSATSIYFSYAALVSALKAYIDGYASKQKYNAPAIIALGVNNDIIVNSTTGKIWANSVVDPVMAYTRKYPHISIAGANDMEPGFIGTPTQTKAWLSGFLSNTTAKFIFNGSADGCNWTTANGRCNNGWTAKDLQWLSGGASPTRILSLPQIYNLTMAKQWKYISLTGVLGKRPRVAFAGPLTEWTACVAQKAGCGSITNNVAWNALWNQINSDSRTRQSSLNYGTDLRIN